MGFDSKMGIVQTNENKKFKWMEWKFLKQNKLDFQAKCKTTFLQEAST